MRHKKVQEQEGAHLTKGEGDRNRPSFRLAIGAVLLYICTIHLTHREEPREEAFQEGRKALLLQAEGGSLPRGPVLHRQHPLDRHRSVRHYHRLRVMFPRNPKLRANKHTKRNDGIRTKSTHIFCTTCMCKCPPNTLTNLCQLQLDKT